MPAGTACSWSRAEEFRQLPKGAMNPGEYRRVAHGRTPALRGAKRTHELAESGKVVGLVRHYEVLVVQPERVSQELAHLRVAMTDLHVLVHNPLPRLFVEEVPLSRFREWVYDQVAGSVAAEKRLFLRSRLLHVLRGLDQADETLRDAHPGAHSAAEPGCRRQLERIKRRCQAPQQQVD